MYQIGLTGGIASGKSSVSNMLRSLGAAIIDADAIARLVVLPSQPAWRQIVEHFGDHILCPDGSLNRRKLGDIVFTDPAERKQLEYFTHPAIWAEAQRQMSTAKADGYRVAVLDAPLLFETHWQDRVDSVWVVFVDQDTQIKRLIQRDGLTLEQAKQRIASQLSMDEKIKLADMVIDNSGDPENTLRQVNAAWQALANII